MKPHLKTKLVLATLLVSSVGAFSASALSFDQNVTPDVIFGSGNTNGGFTTDTQSDVELGLRGKLRYDGTGQPQNIWNSNGNGSYTFVAGVAPTKASPVGVWSFEWSINTNVSGNSNLKLNDLNYALGIDSDPSQGTDFYELDIINGINPGTGTVFWDHALGDNNTGNGAGAVSSDATDYATNIAANSVAQNSWQAHWFLQSFDPTVDGTYNFYLLAWDPASDRFYGEVARTDIQIIVGKGGSAVPDSGSMLLMLSGSILGLIGMRRFVRRS